MKHYGFYYTACGDPEGRRKTAAKLSEVDCQYCLDLIRIFGHERVHLLLVDTMTVEQENEELRSNYARTLKAMHADRDEE